ncbi:hypothetical protein MRB53_041264 [Persea americana]|nr:hypothetical protein MRB53_041264 [Persea americana]
MLATQRIRETRSYLLMVASFVVVEHEAPSLCPGMTLVVFAKPVVGRRIEDVLLKSNRLRGPINATTSDPASGVEESIPRSQKAKQAFLKGERKNR